jgi:hypothetical protein
MKKQTLYDPHTENKQTWTWSVTDSFWNEPCTIRRQNNMQMRAGTGGRCLAELHRNQIHNQIVTLCPDYALWLMSVPVLSSFEYIQIKVNYVLKKVQASETKWTDMWLEQ